MNEQQLSKELESKDKLQNIWSKTANAGGTIKFNELVVRPGKFDGVRTAARRWLEDYESAAVANDWEDRIMVEYFSTFLVKSAKDWFVAVAQPMITESTQWRTLRTMFAQKKRIPSGTNLEKHAKSGRNRQRTSLPES